ncbi:MAG: hypothetical protein GY761_09955, partial [Hyphomicrobiales bacterium]|nr:hypothetical protein [Hyphomicrobiales bacterium]
YGAGIEISGSGIGNATFKDHEQSGVTPAEYQAWQDAGFYAAAYSYNNETVISYRGTDSDKSKDISHGYGVGLGHPEGEQAQLAAKFYQAIAEDKDTGEAHLYDSGIKLTGHSLGGGLSGLIGLIYGANTILFDSMAFELAADNAYAIASRTDAEIDALVADFLEPQQAQAREMLEAERQNILDIYYNGSAQNVQSIDKSNVIGFHVPGEFLDDFKYVSLGSELDETEVGNSANLGTLGIFQKHSMALLAILKFAEENNLDDWHSIATPLWSAAFNDEVGAAAGFDPADTNGHYTEAYKQLAAIAYSALENDEETDAALVFGDTGIRSLFDDANELGLVASGQNNSNLFSDTDANIYKYLSNIIVEFAGLEAL